MVTENWRAVVGHEGFYEASDLGRVKSLDRVDRLNRHRPGRVLSPGLASNGYLMVCFSRDGKTTYRTVHSVVAEAWHGKRQPGLEVCHRNGVRTDNRAVNLRWGTHSSNVTDQTNHGTHHQGKKSRCPEGHLLVAPNLRVAKLAVDGQRSCRACHIMRNRFRRRGVDFRSGAADQVYREIMKDLEANSFE